MIRISVLITLLLGILLNSCEFRQVQTEVEEIDSLVSDTNANAEVLIFPIQLCVDSSLDPLVSRKPSEAFIKLLPDEFESYTINDTVITGEKSSIHIPILLPFNEIVTYTAQNNEIDYELTVKRINLTDLVCLMTVYVDKIIMDQYLDTLTFVPFRYGSSDGSKYGVRLPKYLYSSVKGGIQTHLEVDFFSRKRMYYRKSFPWLVANLETDVYEEPYLVFLDKLISQMGELNYYILRYNRPEDSLRYKRSLFGFKELIGDLTNSGQLNLATKNPNFLDVAVFHQLDEVIEILRFNNFIESRGCKEYCEFVVHKDSLNSLVVGVNHTIGGKVLGECFETIDFPNVRERKQFVQGYREFGTGLFQINEIDFQNFKIKVLHCDGFEMISHLTTIWEPHGESLRFFAILDKLLYAGIGTVSYDTAFRIDNERVFMIARSSGGDAGDVWGSIIFTVWTMPRKLEIYYKVDHFDIYCCPRAKTDADYRFISEEEILISEMKYSFEEPITFESSLVDSTFVQTVINLDSLIRQKPISYFW